MEVLFRSLLMEDKILDWLGNSNRTYSEGLELIKVLCKNLNLVRFLSRGENKVTGERLYEEIKNIAKNLGLKLPVTDVVRVLRNSAPSVKIRHTDNINQVKFEVHKPFDERPASIVLPAEIVELDNRHAYLFRQKDSLRKSLHTYGKSNNIETVRSRLLVIEQILKLKSEIADVKERKRFFEKYGFMPENVQETKDDIIRLQKNARSEIIRQKRLIKEAKNLEAKNKAEIRLAKAEDTKKKMEEKLKKYG